MATKKPTFELAFLLVCLLSLLGCDGSEKERDTAVAEAKQAKAQLAKLKVVLEKTQSETDELRQDIVEISDVLQDTLSELAAVTQAHQQLQNQVDELTRQRNVADAKANEGLAIVEELRNQLEENAKQIQELEQWNSELQATIQQLQEQIEQATGQVSEEVDEQPNEESEKEVADENNV